VLVVTVVVVVVVIVVVVVVVVVVVFIGVNQSVNATAATIPASNKPIIKVRKGNNFLGVLDLY